MMTDEHDHTKLAAENEKMKASEGTQGPGPMKRRRDEPNATATATDDSAAKDPEFTSIIDKGKLAVIPEGRRQAIRTTRCPSCS